MYSTHYLYRFTFKFEMFQYTPNFAFHRSTTLYCESSRITPQMGPRQRLPAGHVWAVENDLTKRRSYMIESSSRFICMQLAKTLPDGVCYLWRWILIVVAGLKQGNDLGRSWNTPGGCLEVYQSHWLPLNHNVRWCLHWKAFDFHAGPISDSKVGLWNYYKWVTPTAIQILGEISWNIYTIYISWAV